MSVLMWDKTGQRYFETGVDHGVVYPLKAGRYLPGVAWNGLVAVNESSSGAEATALYADNVKYLNLMSAEEYMATIEAYAYPEAFAPCIGEVGPVRGVLLGQQARQHFGLSYRTKSGNDTEGVDNGYRLHLIYDCQAAPSDRAYSTISDSPDAMTYSWEVSTTPVEVEGYRPTASIVLDSRKFKTKGLVNVLRSIEEILYGGSNLLVNRFQSQNHNGLTVTVNADKSVTINGTAASTTTIALYDGSYGLYPSAYQPIQNGIYILSGSPHDAEVGKYSLSYRYISVRGTPSQLGRVPVNGVTLDNTDGKYSFLAVYIAVWEGVTVNNVTFRPVLERVEMASPRLPKIIELTELFELGMYVRDADNEPLLDSTGHKIQSRVFE